VATALQRASGTASPSPLTDRPRAGLDEAAWYQLRRSCPPRLGDRPIDLAVAEQLLADPGLYAAAVRVIGASANLAGQPGPTPVAAGPALTGIGGSLSSDQRIP
jgi:hypothetical protein